MSVTYHIGVPSIVGENWNSYAATYTTAYSTSVTSENAGTVTRQTESYSSSGDSAGTTIKSSYSKVVHLGTTKVEYAQNVLNYTEYYVEDTTSRITINAGQWWDAEPTTQNTASSSAHRWYTETYTFESVKKHSFSSSTHGIGVTYAGYLALTGTPCYYFYYRTNGGFSFDNELYSESGFLISYTGFTDAGANATTTMSVGTSTSVANGSFSTVTNFSTVTGNIVSVSTYSTLSSKSLTTQYDEWGDSRTFIDFGGISIYTTYNPDDDYTTAQSNTFTENTTTSASSYYLASTSEYDTTYSRSTTTVHTSTGVLTYSSVETTIVHSTYSTQQITEHSYYQTESTRPSTIMNTTSGGGATSIKSLTNNQTWTWSSGYTDAIRVKSARVTTYTDEFTTFKYISTTKLQDTTAQYITGANGLTGYQNSEFQTTIGVVWPSVLTWNELGICTWLSSSSSTVSWWYSFEYTVPCTTYLEISWGIFGDIEKIATATSWSRGELGYRFNNSTDGFAPLNNLGETMRSYSTNSFTSEATFKARASGTYSESQNIDSISLKTIVINTVSISTDVFTSISTYSLWPFPITNQSTYNVEIQVLDTTYATINDIIGYNQTYYGDMRTITGKYLQVFSTVMTTYLNNGQFNSTYEITTTVYRYTTTRGATGENVIIKNISSTAGPTTTGVATLTGQVFTRHVTIFKTVGTTQTRTKYSGLSPQYITASSTQISNIPAGYVTTTTSTDSTGGTALSTLYCQNGQVTTNITYETTASLPKVVTASDSTQAITVGTTAFTNDATTYTAATTQDLATTCGYYYTTVKNLDAGVTQVIRTYYGGNLEWALIHWINGNMAMAGFRYASAPERDDQYYLEADFTAPTKLVVPIFTSYNLVDSVGNIYSTSDLYSCYYGTTSNDSIFNGDSPMSAIFPFLSLNQLGSVYEFLTFSTTHSYIHQRGHLPINSTLEPSLGWETLIYSFSKNSVTVTRSGPAPFYDNTFEYKIILGENTSDSYTMRFQLNSPVSPATRGTTRFPNFPLQAIGGYEIDSTAQIIALLDVGGWQQTVRNRGDDSGEVTATSAIDEPFGLPSARNKTNTVAYTTTNRPLTILNTMSVFSSNRYAGMKNLQLDPNKITIIEPFVMATAASNTGIEILTLPEYASTTAA